MTKSSTPKLLSEAHRKTDPKVATGKARLTNGKASPKVAVQDARDASPKPAPKVRIAEARDAALKPAPKVATEKASNAQSEAFRDPQVPNSMRALAERNVAQTRELYERSKNTLHAVLESIERSYEGTVALSRRIIDIAERNVSSGFELAMSLAGAKNLAEVMNLQAAYWRKQFGNLSAQAEELRALSTKVATSVTEPIKAQVTDGMDA
jgi:phasin